MDNLTMIEIMQFPYFVNQLSEKIFDRIGAEMRKNIDKVLGIYPLGLGLAFFLAKQIQKERNESFPGSCMMALGHYEPENSGKLTIDKDTPINIGDKVFLVHCLCDKPKKYKHAKEESYYLFGKDTADEKRLEQLIRQVHIGTFLGSVILPVPYEEYPKPPEK